MIVKKEHAVTSGAVQARFGQVSGAGPRQDPVPKFRLDQVEECKAGVEGRGYVRGLGRTKARHTFHVLVINAMQWDGESTSVAIRTDREREREVQCEVRARQGKAALIDACSCLMPGLVASQAAMTKWLSRGAGQLDDGGVVRPTSGGFPVFSFVVFFLSLARFVLVRGVENAMGECHHNFHHRRRYHLSIRLSGCLRFQLQVRSSTFCFCCISPQIAARTFLFGIGRGQAANASDSFW